jgi:SAM-dependent methyltransferase
MDPATLKAAQHKQWSGAAAGWRKHDAVLHGHLAPLTERMVGGLRPGQRVLDLCSGTGEPALSAAVRVQPDGHVTGVDFAEEMLAVARDKAAQRGLTNVEFRAMDAEALDFPAGHFDAATFRFGLMFMPGPVGCLAGIRRVLKPGSGLTVACWADAALNPWAAIPAACVKKALNLPEPEPTAPGMFAFADAVRLQAALSTAGFSQVRVEPLELLMADMDTGAQFVAFTREVGGSLRMAVEKLPLDRLQRLEEEVAREVEQAGGGRARLTGVAWVATARS